MDARNGKGKGKVKGGAKGETTVAITISALAMFNHEFLLIDNSMKVPNGTVDGLVVTKQTVSG